VGFEAALYTFPLFGLQSVRSASFVSLSIAAGFLAVGFLCEPPTPRILRVVLAVALVTSGLQLGLGPVQANDISSLSWVHWSCVALGGTLLGVGFLALRVKTTSSESSQNEEFPPAAN
jgi:predicted membrane channel-forming protein YqfA (hemolysin III family)